MAESDTESGSQRSTLPQFPHEEKIRREMHQKYYRAGNVPVLTDLSDCYIKCLKQRDSSSVDSCIVRCNYRGFQKLTNQFKALSVFTKCSAHQCMESVCKDHPHSEECTECLQKCTQSAEEI